MIVALMILIPILFFGGICFLVGNAIPALVGAGLSLVAMLLFYMIAKQENSGSGALGFVFFFLIALVVAIVLALSFGVYYLSLWLGS